MTRDREEEMSAHQDRGNRYLQYDMQPAAESYARDVNPHRQTMDSYRPADSRYQSMRETNHRGKGPRNYKRSDDRIKELVCDLFCDNPDLDASNIDVEVKNAEVILSGQVEERREKHLAEELSESVTGVTNVENRIRVSARQKG